jgi:hypothetical protein
LFIKYPINWQRVLYILKRWGNKSSSKCNECSNDGGGNLRKMPVGGKMFDVEPVFWSEMFQVFSSDVKKIIENFFYEGVK